MLDYGGFRVETRTVETMLIASICWRGTYGESNAAFSRLYGEMGRYACGKPMDLYHHDFPEEDTEVESAIPVSRVREVPGITFRELPGGRAVTLLHQGPYDSLGVTFERVMLYTEKHRLQFLLPMRVVYVRGPGLIWRKPNKYLTEVVVLVE